MDNTRDNLHRVEVNSNVTIYLGEEIEQPKILETARVENPPVPVRQENVAIINKETVATTPSSKVQADSENEVSPMIFIYWTLGFVGFIFVLFTFLYLADTAGLCG